MSTEDLIDITLITYNRAPQFEKTLEMLFAPDSPVRNCLLTILDNRSDDATPQIAGRYAAAHPNVTHKVNNFNVGGNANIAKAMEMYGARPYHWILCDDDTYDWSGWPDVEEAMRRGEKLICAGDRYLPAGGDGRADPALQLQQMTFLPSIIYGPGTITDTAMRNAYESTFALFQHLAPVVAHLNRGGAIYTAKRGIVRPGEYGNDISYTRGCAKEEVFARSRTMTLAVGFANLTLNLKDRRLSKRAFRALVFGPQMGALGFFGEIFFRLRGRDGASAFRDVMNQAPLWAKSILLPLRLVQNSPLYHLLASKWLYAKARQLTDWMNTRARMRLKT